LFPHPIGLSVEITDGTNHRRCSKGTLAAKYDR
jgi:hypothetical protein